MTDLWRAGGAATNKRPAEWLRKDGASFVAFLQVSLDVALSHIKKTSKKGGGGGETWGHWQLALSYAQWISPEFHARVNEVYRAYMAGQLVPRDDEAVRLALRIKALDSKDYESGWVTELKLEFCRLRKVRGYGHKPSDADVKGRWTPGPGKGAEPQALAYAYGTTWRVILGDHVYEELKRRNPHPKAGTLHGQWLQDERMKLVRREDMVVTMFVARRATRWADYEREMRSHFRRAPIQLRLVTGSTPLRLRDTAD